MSTCTQTITPADAARFQEILGALPEGAVLCLGAGVYRANLFLERSVTLRGLGQVIVDGHGHSTTIKIKGDAKRVVLERLTLSRGFGGALGNAGNLEVLGDSEVTVREVELTGGASESYGGGGFIADGGRVLFDRCRLSKNSGKQAAAGVVKGSARVTLRDSVIVDNQPGPQAAALLVTEIGELVLDHCTVLQPGGPAIQIDGRATQAPRVSFEGSIVGEVKIFAPGPEPVLHARDTAFAGPLAHLDGHAGNVLVETTVDAQGHAPAGSPAAGRGPR